MKSTAGELVAVIWAIKIAIEEKYEKIKIFHDFSGLKTLLNENTDSKRRYIVVYQRYLDYIKDEIEIEFIKVKSHSGDKYNNLSDKLAKKACLVKY